MTIPLKRSKLERDKTCVVIVKSKNKDKKFTAQFKIKNQNENENEQTIQTIKIKSVDFGGAGYDDYTIHKDEKRKESYLKRHKKNEDWSDFKSAGALSRYILWNKKTFAESFDNYVKTFRTKLTRCLSPKIWGAALWNVMHLAANNKNIPKSDLKSLIHSISQIIPCRLCRNNFQKELKFFLKKKTCCDALDLIKIHNLVNKRLKKNLLTKEEADDINRRRRFNKGDFEELIHIFIFNFKRQGFKQTKNSNSNKFKHIENFKNIIIKYYL